jgi:hypothetical protein
MAKRSIALIDVSKSFGRFECWVEINSAWETIRENINISAKESNGYYELKNHKPWFNEGCSKGNKLNCSGARSK